MWNDYIEDEVIDTPETEIIEEDVIIDEKFIKNKELIRMDLNIIQFPIFSKNTQRKVNQIVKYFFNKNRDTYITVKPVAGDYIPGEMEEKVFIALMQIMKERNMPQKFIISAYELRNKLKLNNDSHYNSVIKKSLLRLSETNYNFKNTMYSSELGGIIGKEVSTSILSLEIINLSLKMNQKYREKVNDKRIKEIYKISISDHFYRNIIQKGYLVYNSETLLNISSSTGRTVYMLIEKIRFKNLYLKLDTLFLIKRIPLKYNKKNISQTIKILEKALNELVEKKLILNFKFIKESTWEKSEVEFNFLENSNDEKQNRFYNDRNDFRKIISLNSISETEHEMLEELKPISSNETDVTNSLKELPTEENIDRILGLLPSKARNLKTMGRTIGEAIEKYGYEKVKKSAIYTKQQKADKIRSYFLKTLENNWANDIEEPVVKNSKIENKAINTDLSIEDIPKYNKELYNQFEKLTIEEKNKIEKEAYKIYILKCGGVNTKIQEIAFKYGKKQYICEIMEKYTKTDIKEQVIEKNKNTSVKIIENQNYDVDVTEIKNRILQVIQFGAEIYDYSEEEKNNLYKEILKEVMRLIIKKEFSDEKLTEIIGKYIEI